jgi:signal transduction histidine kinase
MVVLSIAAIALIEILSDSVLDQALPFPWDTLTVIAVVAVLGVIGARLAFRSIDRLALTLRERNAALEASDASARALHRVSMSLSTLTDLNDILRAVVEQARLLLDADIALLILVRPDATLRLAASSGPVDAFSPEGRLTGSDFRRFVRADMLRGHLAAPLRRGGREIGTLAVGSRGGRAYTVDAVETLESLASQAAIAIENDRLAAELREMAVRGERERIAREMHDGLAQVLGYVNTKSQAVEELLAAGRTEAARGQLSQLAAAARSVYVDVREAILGLTSPIPAQGGLVGAIEEYARRFSDASKLATSVEASPAARRTRLSPEAQAGAFRIVQEALTNIRKHAAAHRALIHVDTDARVLRIFVEDDGRGFDPGSADERGWPHFGLQAMHERAAALGGTLVMQNRDPGTRLELRVPLISAQEVA